MKKDKNSPSTAMARRNFIFSALRREGRVREKDLREAFDPARQSMLDDIEFFKQLGVRVERVFEDKSQEYYFVDRDHRHTKAKESREKLESVEKQAIANFAAGLVLGIPTDVPPPGGLEAVYNQGSALSALKDKSGRTLCDKKRHEISYLLKKFWSASHRRIAIDAGTTNDPTARLLSRVQLPSDFCSLSSLSICTNSRGMFQLLGEPGVAPKVIIIGGEQVGTTESIAGPLSQLFVQNAGLLHFGISFIGATAVDMGARRPTGVRFCSHSHQESILKNTLLEKSGLRIICVDDSKFQDVPMTESYHFCSAHPDQIDLIITNEPNSKNARFKDMEEFSEYKRSFNAKIAVIEELGVPVVKVALPLER